MTSASDLALQPRTFEARDHWMRALLASDMPHTAKTAGMRLALHLHVDSGRCNPSFATLAAECRIGERTLYRLVALLQHAGWLAVQGGGGRRLTNQYVLLNPAIAVAEFQRAETLTNRAQNPANKVADKKRRKDSQGTLKRSPERGRENARRARDHSPSGAALKAPAGMEAGESKKAPAGAYTQHPSAPAAPAANVAPADEEIVKAQDAQSVTGEVVALDHERGWRELRGLWRRGHESDDMPRAIAVARAAFIRACREGAQPEAILDAARKRIAAADAARYLPSLPTWLAGGCKPEPPKKVSKNSTHSRGRPERRRRKVDMAAMGAAYGDWVEEHDAECNAEFEAWKARHEAAEAERRAAS
jgi:hypothetical protein